MMKEVRLGSGVKNRKYPFHLCQPDFRKSCGACCGLYNWEDHSRATLTSLLKKRTKVFLTLGVYPDPERYRAMSQILSASEKLCETIYNCEFLGFVDAAQRRVGCLLHPSLHQGRDLRTCSFYGAELCGGHFCISFTSLSFVEQEAVIGSLDDWYLYGLVITDIDLVKEFFTHTQNRLGEGLRSERLKDEEVRGALREFFSLKEYWRFASKGKRLGKYCFSHAEYQIARIEYEKNWGITPSRFDKILVSLSSDFTTVTEVHEAEAIIEEKVGTFIEAYQKG